VAIWDDETAAKVPTSSISPIVVGVPLMTRRRFPFTVRVPDAVLPVVTPPPVASAMTKLMLLVGDMVAVTFVAVSALVGQDEFVGVWP
jgi:hypothetical protein